METTPLIIIISTAVIAILVIALIFGLSKKKGKNDTFIITGICNSGKTSLFMLLRNGKNVTTHTSMSENEDRFPLYNESENTEFHVIDFPGHFKLRYKYQDFTPIVKGVIFMVDSSTFIRNEREVAEYMYEIIADKSISQKEVPILIVCNKQDYLISLPKERIKAGLEEEINNLRSTRAAGVEGQDEDNADDYLGYENEKFKFEHIANTVTFVECELKSGNEESGLTEIKQWMIENYN